MQGTDGNFYGTTIFGGANAEGTVFKVTPGGQLTTLYSFCSQSGCTDGEQPIAGLVQAGGNFYGTAEFGGANNGGTVFELTPGGQFTLLYGFCSQPYCADGAGPAGGLVQANGNLYGTTVNAGIRGVGTFFGLPLAQQGLSLSCPTYGAQLGVAYNSALTATGGVGPYTFSIISGSLPPGLTLNTSTGAITGTPTTAGVYNFVAQVVDSQSNTVTTNCGIVVVPVPLTLSCPTPTGAVGVLYSSALTATGGVAPYTFSIASGSLPPGLTLNTSTGAITGTPTTAGTYNFTARVVDSKGNTATASCGITINPTLSCTNNGSLNGNYAFLFQGWSNFNGSGYVLTPTAGSLVSDGNGNITSGQYDQNDPVDGPTQGTLTGTYCVPTNNQGTMTINSSNGHTATYAFVLQPNGNGNIIPYDTTTPWDASGILLKQNTSDFSTSDFTGQYSLGFIGVDNSNNRFGLAGAFTANGTANLTNGELDGDDGGNYFNGTFSSNNFSVTPSGRGTVTLNVSGVGTGNFAFYVVNSSQVLIIQIDPIAQGLQSLFSGQVVQQQGLTYTDSDLNGVSVLGLQGLDTTCNPACADAQLGFITWNGVGSLSFTGDENDGGTVSSNSGLGGTYSVGSNGRVAISGGGNHNPIFYLTIKNAGFSVSSGGSKVQFGSMVAQSGSNFNNNSISGNYYGGTSELVSTNTCGELDLANVSSGSGNDTSEKNCGESPRSKSSSFSYSVSSDGRTVITTDGFPSGITYIVSPSSGGSGGSFFFLPWEGNSNPTLQSYGVVSSTITLGCPTGTAQVNVGYSSALVASGGVAPYTFSILSGSLPPGLTLNTSTGAITGTPTTAGTYNFSAQVVDSQGNTATSNCSIVVSPALTLSCPTGTAQVGVAYSSALTASGGVAPYTFSITSGSLPPGLTLNASTGAITGTPTTAGTYNFTAQVADSQGNTATSSCSIAVSRPLAELSNRVGAIGSCVQFSTNSQRWSRTLHLLDHQRFVASGLDAQHLNWRDHGHADDGGHVQLHRPGRGLEGQYSHRQLQHRSLVAEAGLSNRNGASGGFVQLGAGSQRRSRPLHVLHCCGRAASGTLAQHINRSGHRYADDDGHIQLHRPGRGFAGQHSHFQLQHRSWLASAFAELSNRHRANRSFVQFGVHRLGRNCSLHILHHQRRAASGTLAQHINRSGHRYADDDGNLQLHGPGSRFEGQHGQRQLQHCCHQSWDQPHHHQPDSFAFEHPRGLGRARSGDGNSHAGLGRWHAHRIGHILQRFNPNRYSYAQRRSRDV